MGGCPGFDTKNLSRLAAEKDGRLDAVSENATVKTGPRSEEDIITNAPVVLFKVRDPQNQEKEYSVRLRPVATVQEWSAQAQPVCDQEASVRRLRKRLGELETEVAEQAAALDAAALEGEEDHEAATELREEYEANTERRDELRGLVRDRQSELLDVMLKVLCAYDPRKLNWDDLRASTLTADQLRTAFFRVCALSDPLADQPLVTALKGLVG